MDIQILNEKLELIQWLSTLENKSIIRKLSEFRKKETEDWNTISEEEKVSVDKGIEQADNNELKPHSSARKRYEKWL